MYGAVAQKSDIQRGAKRDGAVVPRILGARGGRLMNMAAWLVEAYS